MQINKKKLTTQEVGKVLQLYVSIKGETNREPLSRIEVDAKGIIGDKFYAKDDNRAILISSQASYDLAQSHGITMPDGFLGENIFVDYNPYYMQAGDQFYIGDVLLEITQNCTLCNSLSKVNSTLPKLLKDDRGIFAKAITPGVIHTNDTFKLINT